MNVQFIINCTSSEEQQQQLKNMMLCNGQNNVLSSNLVRVFFFSFRRIEKYVNFILNLFVTSLSA